MMLRLSSCTSRTSAAAALKSLTFSSRTAAATTASVASSSSRRLLHHNMNHVVAAASATRAVDMSSSHYYSNNNNNNTLRFFSDSKKDDDEKANQQQEEEQEQAAAAENNNDDDLQQELQDLKDQLLRSLAEQENIRTIARNDIQQANQFAITKFAKSLLDVSDNLDRALESVTDEDKTNTAFNNFYQGIELTQQGLTKALQANGCTLIDLNPGDAFDPSLHSALMEYPDDLLQAGSVGQVIKKGFRLNGRVLRPAQVGVVKK